MYLCGFCHPPLHPNLTSNKVAENSYFRNLQAEKFRATIEVSSDEAITKLLGSQSKGKKEKIMKNTLTLTQEELATLVANAVAQALTLTSVSAQAYAPTQAHTPTIAPAQTPAPTAVQTRTYEHVKNGFDNFVIKTDKKFVLAVTRDKYVLTSANGKKSVIEAGTPLAFAYGHKDAWDAFKARMRNAGATYVPEAKLWAFPSAKAAKTFAEGEGAKPFTTGELNAVRDNWTRKAEKRAKKAE